MRALFAIAAFATALASQPALADSYNNHYSTARKAALQFAKQRYGRLGRVSVARKPLLDTAKGQGAVRPRTPIRAYGVSIDGKQRKEAVVVQGKLRRYQAQGIAAVHYVPKPVGNAVKDLGTTFNMGVILRTRARGTKMEARNNLSFMGEGVARGKRSALFKPRFRPWIERPPMPGQPQAAVFPGPSGHVQGEASIQSPKGQTIAKKGFQRFVIMNNDGAPTPVAQPAVR